ncbi:sulfite exporter TauE/SafE family protein [Legionella maceachernii]|uniref:Integral membrane protein n=1 Tax=Legionella maceachernii TaxID=466 RepID=A0A0W0VVL8_9GAMM|nr:sulfite exporter TauE/SafE family protein [Legionella maceachernii]KTD24062.1 integral membrane protein [Legionella maceachernii]SJZ85232.1 Sulfite exporter TauE/SafE [Legionella maceachernii]SUO99245.1 Sulfite exporter TauE/SafE [Legionella maceachernii]
MAITFLIYAIVILSVICVVAMFYRLKYQPSVQLSFLDYVKLSISGILAFIADTLGIGSFAVNVALAKLLGTFPDDELPAVNNGAQVIPGTFESFFFMQLIDVDLGTLITLVTGTCLGGLIGGAVVSRLSKQAIRLAMMCCFAVIIGLLICHQLRVMPVGGDLVELHSWRLVVGFFAMIVCGALTSVGIGLFVMVQAVLFLMNVSPVVAFPIMTTAGAMQQPLTTLVFVQQNKIPLKKTLILSVAGCIGVFITLPLFTHITVTWLHSLLLCILIYNLFAISRAYFRSRSRRYEQATTSSLAV